MREPINIKPDIMESIYSFEGRIPIPDAMEQMISVNPQHGKWVKLFSDYPIIREVLDGLEKDGKGYCHISRKDVFAEKDNARKAILVLLWGFPGGYRNSDTHRNAVKSALEIAEEINDRNLTETMFKAMMAKKSIGLSTLSKILYFFEYKVDGNRALILDSRVRANLRAFPEFKETICNRAGSFEEYTSYVNRMTEIANKMSGVTPDQLEFFLFNCKL